DDVRCDDGAAGDQRPPVPGRSQARRAAALDGLVHRVSPRTERGRQASAARLRDLPPLKIQDSPPTIGLGNPWPDVADRTWTAESEQPVSITRHPRLDRGIGATCVYHSPPSVGPRHRSHLSPSLATLGCTEET